MNKIQQNLLVNATRKHSQSPFFEVQVFDHISFRFRVFSPTRIGIVRHFDCDYARIGVDGQGAFEDSAVTARRYKFRSLHLVFGEEETLRKIFKHLEIKPSGLKTSSIKDLFTWSHFTNMLTTKSICLIFIRVMGQNARYLKIHA